MPRRLAVVISLPRIGVHGYRAGDGPRGACAPPPPAPPPPNQYNITRGHVPLTFCTSNSLLLRDRFTIIFLRLPRQTATARAGMFVKPCFFQNECTGADTVQSNGGGVGEGVQVHGRGRAPRP